MKETLYNFRGCALRIAIGISLVALLLAGGAGAVPVKQWEKTFGGTSTDEALVVQQTSDGYVLAGYTSSYGAGYADAWLIKTDANGSEQWNKTFGGTLLDAARSMQQISDGYVLAGSKGSYGVGRDFWLIKTDANGNETWNRTFGGVSDDDAWSVQKTSDDGFILAGSTYSYRVSSGAWSYDVWLIKTDASGNETWNKTFGGAGYDFAYSVQQTTDNGYILTGTTDFDVGYTNVDAWLIKTDASGNETWNKTFGGAVSDTAHSVQQLSDGYILAGCTVSFGNGDCDFWLIKTDANGNETWNRTFGGAGSDVAWSVQRTSDGGFILAGATNSIGFGSDAWLIKTDASGNEQWNKTFGIAGFNDHAFSVQQTTDGYILAGTYGAGGDDAWLIKVTEDSTSNSIDSCTTISSPGEYVLNTSIINSGASSCISINSSNVIFDGSGHTIDGIDGLGTNGVYVNQATALTNVTVKNLTVTDWAYGIKYWNVNNGNIENIDASSNVVGIQLIASNYNKLKNNRATLTPCGGMGIGMENSHYNNLTGNTANQNDGTGIILGGASSNNNLTGNNLSSNGDMGIWLTGSNNNNIFTGNILTGNGFGACGSGKTGIGIGTSSNNILTDNTVKNNLRGIVLSNSNDNTIYNNIFNNSNNYAIEGSSTNTWNTTKTPGTNIIGGPNLGGNFWGKPDGTGFSQTCTDSGEDEICDSTYVLDANNTDYLPLASPGSYRVYVPWTATTQGWTTPYVIANKGSSNASVNISYYNQADGSKVGTYSTTILPGASKFVFREWTLSTSGTDGSAVLTSDQMISVIVDQFNNGENKFGAYEVDPSGSKEVFLPWTATTQGWTTPFVIENRGTANATVNITYYNVTGSEAGNHSVDILPGASKFVFREWSAGGDGAARLSSDQPVSVLVDMLKNSENKFGAYTPASLADTQVFIPWTATTQGWSTPFKIVNRGTSTSTVYIAYYNQANGLQAGTDSVSIAPNEVVTVFRENSTANGTDGSAIIGCNCSGPFSVIVQQFNNAQGKFEVYTPAMTASNTIVIPWTATTQGWTTPYVIVNRGSENASVNISYYNQADGSYVGNYSTTILPGASKFVFREWTLSASTTDGSAVVVSDQPITVMVDQFNNGQNKFGAYTPIG